MKKCIRWPGLLAFGVVILMLAGFWWLLIDGIIERWIEKSGTRLLGARVELGKADLTLVPLGLALEDLHVTNPEQPMTNMVAAGSIHLAIEASHLLRRKLIISRMIADNLRFNTPRQTSGAIAPKPTSAEKALSKPAGREGKTIFGASKMTLPDLPDVKEILAREELQTVAAANALKNDIIAFRNGWRTRLEELPDEDTFAQYEKRLDKVAKSKQSLSGMLGAAGEAKAIHDDLNQDLKKLDQAIKEFEKGLDPLNQKFSRVKSMPVEDYRRLRAKYSFSAQGAVNITYLLFGDKAGRYLKLFLDGYRTLKPLLEMRPTTPESRSEAKPVRGRGIDVHFAVNDQPPPFLVSLAKVSATIPAGVISGEIRNLTPYQALLGKPLVFAFAGRNLQELRTLNLDGVMDHVDPDKTSDQFTATMAGLRIEGDRQPIYLEKGLADMKLAATLNNSRINARLTAAVSSASIAVAGPIGDERLEATLKEALAEISAFDLTADIQGEVDDYRVSLSSDIDDTLKSALNQQLKKKAGAFENSLKQAIAEKTKAPLAKNSSLMAEVDSIEEELISRLGLGDALRKEVLRKAGLK